MGASRQAICIDFGVEPNRLSNSREVPFGGRRGNPKLLLQIRPPQPSSSPDLLDNPPLPRLRRRLALRCSSDRLRADFAADGDVSGELIAGAALPGDDNVLAFDEKPVLLHHFADALAKPIDRVNDGLCFVAAEWI